MYAQMPRYSPDGHLIGPVTGDAGAIRTRGQNLQSLANKMDSSATLLRQLVENGADMEGEAVDKLREVSEKAHKDLQLGADLYDAVAPHMVTYAADLERYQASINVILGDLESLWATYQQKHESAISATSARPKYPRGEDADDPVLRRQAEDLHDDAVERAQGNADAARRDWDDRAGNYDNEWDNWFDAFNKAARGIKEDTTNGIEDSLGDNLDGFLQFMSDFLAVAGIILAVLAIIVGGPIIAALAAIVAVATLIVAVARLSRGEGTVLDVVFGVIGVIPLVGPAVKFARGPAAMVSAAGWGDDAARFVNFSGGGRQWLSGMNTLKGGGFTNTFADFTAKLFTGQGVDDIAAISGGWQTADMVGNIFASKFAIAGGIKDSAGGAWQGAFDADQNPWEKWW